MKRIELDLEHRYKNRFVGRHTLRSEGERVFLGSACQADIRLLGEDVNGVHAVVEFGENGWVLIDLGSEHGTWVNKEPVVSHEIKDSTVVNIGGHHLRLVPKEIEVELFKKTDASEVKGGQKYHQVVVRHHGLVVQSLLLRPHEPYKFPFGREWKELPAPKSEQWTEQQIGPLVISQRLVSSQTLSDSALQKIKTAVDPSLRKPLAAASLLLGLIWALMTFAPQKPDDELTAVKPEQNQYTRIIYDANKVRQNREQSMKLRKTIAGKSSNQRSQNRSSLSTSTASPSKGKSTQVVSRIKAAGLTQLIGKISKRAAKSGVFVQATGQSPDTASGPALALPGTIGQISKKGGGTDKQYKIAGVGTEGKAGGSTSYKGVGGLAVGNVGNATVGVLEEETEIQGGLDRDVIAAVINSELGQIRYCYERQLSANPDLYGKVLVKFTIGAEGTVVAQMVGSSTLNNAMVEGCMLRRIAGWKFPKPKGGTTVLVTYPFLFKATN